MFLSFAACATAKPTTGQRPVDLGGTWQGELRVIPCPTGILSNDSGRCDAVNQITFNLLQTDSSLLGTYHCAIGTRVCRDANTTDYGKVIDSSVSGRNVTLRVLLPGDLSTCLYNGLFLRRTIWAEAIAAIREADWLKSGNGRQAAALTPRKSLQHGAQSKLRDTEVSLDLVPACTSNSVAPSIPLSSRTPDGISAAKCAFASACRNRSLASASSGVCAETATGSIVVRSAPWWQRCTDNALNPDNAPSSEWPLPTCDVLRIDTYLVSVGLGRYLLVKQGLANASSGNLEARHSIDSVNCQAETIRLVLDG
jgi:hypothetical protein